MRGSSVRSFSLVDAMILVAAIGTGLAAIRGGSPAYYIYPHTPIPPPTWVEWSAFVVPAYAFYSLPVPAFLTWAILTIRAGGARLGFADPGSIAALGASVAIASGVVFFILDLRNPSYHEMPFEYTAYSAGIAVAASWITLLATGTWRPHRDWIDRAGRCLECYWMAMIPIVLFRTFAR